MIIPAWLFSILLWLALAVIAAGTGYLIAVLIAEWRRGALW